jgi:hypothetical protein
MRPAPTGRRANSSICWRWSITIILTDVGRPTPIERPDLAYVSDEACSNCSRRWFCLDRANIDEHTQLPGCHHFDSAALITPP